MLNIPDFYNELKANGVGFFTGVPDSYLNGFCNHVLRSNDGKSHMIAANEGNAIGIAAGHYIATGEIPLVYMQNSGMGNTVNPLASLADEHVYAIPMILLIGWRGEPGMGDWAQHELQGEITTKLLDIMNIPYEVLTDNDEEAGAMAAQAASTAKRDRRAYALIVPKGILSGEKVTDEQEGYPMSREDAIEVILDNMPADTVYSATTGRATRELFFLRERRGESLKNDFLNVGSMGHASSVALGIAAAKPDRQVVCLDGDSAAIMHLGALTMASKYAPANFLHVILNNGAHESVGGQPSAGQDIDLTGIARACGYETLEGPVTTAEELTEGIRALSGRDRAGFMDVRIHTGLKGKLPPLDFSHREAIDELIDNLNSRSEEDE